MGRGRRKGGSNRGWGGRNKNPKGRDDDNGVQEPVVDHRESYTNPPLENEIFERYYKAQNVLPDEEWESFMTSLRTLLPTTFRLTGSRRDASDLLALMKTRYFPGIADFESEGVMVPAPTPIPWYPNEMAWHWTCPRNMFRKSPALGDFHEFLHAENETGNISRQEAVSMIPVLFLDVQPHHYVLDTCAAPGSKTGQIIEALHAETDNPSGLIVANDADYLRSHTLVRQTKRLQSPCLMVTNHDATVFPHVRLNAEGAPVELLRFDRILCDVPCSGDGTLRKNRGEWRNWSVSKGNGMHRTQLRILMRALQLAKVGARIVYSTCTFNPIEDEAVVAAALNLSEGSLRILDVSDKLPALRRKSGLSTWKVMFPSGTICDSHEEVPEEDKKKAKRGIPETLFTPKNAAELGLEKCVRVYPHLQDTGGFFICLLEKVAPFGPFDKAAVEGVPMVEEAAEEVGEEDKMAMAEDSKEKGGRNKRKRGDRSDDVPRNSKKPRAGAEEGAEHTQTEEAAPAKEVNKEEERISKNFIKAWEGRGEEPFYFLTPESDDVVSFENFYGLAKEFPRDQFVVRSTVSKNTNIYFVGEGVKRILMSPSAGKLNFVNTGVKVFSRQTIEGNKSAYRLSGDGLMHIVGHMGDRRVFSISLADVLTMLNNENPKFDQLSEATEAHLRGIEQGSCVFKYNPSSDPENAAQIRSMAEVVMPVWRANVSVSALLNRQVRQSLFLRLGKERSEFEYQPQESHRRIRAAKIMAEAAGNDSPAADLDEDEEDGKELKEEDV
ncbi:S-adenosyl-L-methionine-dependent methyltransferase [Cladochytrium replicatum]|nr:S-adenosyl-L-methionine-dependent methyltransferase [Cladochytrium replicatum]